MVYDEKTQFNEYNVVTYMAEMEEHLSRLVRDIASANGNEFAVISSLPMEILPAKTHVKAPMQIDPFETPTVDTEDELIIDEVELYKKFVKS